MKKSKLYNRIVSDENIYLAIYKIDSYIFEKELLCNQDIKLLNSLKDKFNDKLLKGVINKVKELLEGILIGEEFFKVQVYLRPKKVDEKTGNIIFRPLHTCSLYAQIAMVAMLNVLIYEEAEGILKLNELEKMVPHNFYGNVISNKVQELYVPWQKKYREYSNAATEAYKRAVETGEYKYEVSLDIQEFFPSIDPRLVYQMIYSRFSIKYDNKNDKECFKRILFKLLFFRLEPMMKEEKDQLEDYMYEYYGENYNTSWIKGYCKGIAQGLPTAYFFANIVMSKLASIFEEEFLGQAYYYVDDSVQYVNDGNEFSYKLDRINSKIKKWYKDQLLDIEYPSYKGEKFKESIAFSEQCGYEIKVHKEGKSNIEEINKDKQGQNYLNMLSKMASMGAMELKNIFSDSEDITLGNRFRAINESIEKELQHIDKIKKEKAEPDSYKQYRKMLVRFNKYFKFRIRVIEDKSVGEVSKDQIEELIRNLKINPQNKHADIERYFKIFDEDIFMAEFSYILNNIKSNTEYEKIKTALDKFNAVIYCKEKEIAYIAYFDKLFNGYKYKNLYVRSNENKRYLSITRAINNKLFRSYKLNDNIRDMKLKQLFKALGKTESEYNFRKYMPKDKMYRLVKENTDEITRMYLNTIISTLLNVKVEEMITPNKLDNRPLTYVELRILAYVRNKQFRLEDFILFTNNLDLNDKTIIDYSVFQVLSYFKEFVKVPEHIDRLIQVHKYTTDMWKNGSKFLYFYTLHNQEHAIGLIKTVCKLVKSIESIQIKPIDYYIIFMACYLHDIAMVVYPDLNHIMSSEKNFEANLIYTEFMEEVYSLGYNLEFVTDTATRELLVNYYKKMDGFFEKYIRDHHVVKSAQHITKSSDLVFVEETIREIIAEVSKAHGYDSQEVYGVKSNAKEELISKKYLKILLRLADALDISESRVTKTILDNNIMHMSESSKFHWISHRVIEGYDIVTKYNNTALEKDIPQQHSYLHKDNMEEEIIIRLKINVGYNQKVPPNNCTIKNLSPKKLRKKNIPNKLILVLNIQDEKKEKDCNNNCNFMCKWMSKKNEYLYNELYELQRYLNRSRHSTYFNSKIKIELEIDEKVELEQKYYDIVSGYINE